MGLGIWPGPGLGRGLLVEAGGLRRPLGLGLVLGSWLGEVGVRVTVSFCSIMFQRLSGRSSPLHRVYGRAHGRKKSSSSGVYM